MFTDEERERIVAELQMNLARLRNFQPGCRIPEADPSPPRLDASERREWRLPEPEPPKPEQKLDTDPSRTRDAWNAWADQKIAAAIDAEREFMLEVVGQWAGAMMEEQKKAQSAEAKELRTELTRLQAMLAEYRALLSVDHHRSAPLDIPNPLSSKRVN
jgi:hypothetical protein